MKIVRPFRVAPLATLLSALILSPTLFDQTRRYQATPKAQKYCSHPRQRLALR